MKRHVTAVAFLLMATVFVMAQARRRPEAPRPTVSPISSTGPVSTWPRPVPVRLKPQGRDEILVTTLGDVSTPFADGLFDPIADRVTLSDGRSIDRYFKDKLEIPFFQPLDKSRFSVPPSGWCSWYYYYQEITPEEVLANAAWISKHLAPFGARYVQVDDGWQGTGHGLGSNRDWTTIDVRFRTLGMQGLAKGIREAGLEPGIWLAPHGQSNEQVARRSQAFMWKPDGTTAVDSWEGTYLLDPTAPTAKVYLGDLFRRLRSWGYSYFKIDGQPTVVREYARALQFMAGTKPEGKPEDVAANVYRSTLPAIRNAIGSESYLLTSWGIALPAMGLVNGARSGGDVFQGWEGFLIAATAVQQWNFLHNIAWYADPDVLLVRPPIADGTVRAWATIFALTGQALMASDRLTDLPESRIELLRRVYPAVDIRPLDLYRPDNVLKPVVDLKINHLGRRYDVVGVFNYDTERTATRLVSWSELRLDESSQYHVYDFWGGTYLGAWEHGVFVDIPPADARVLALVPAGARPVLVSTSRHITQGWPDLMELQEGGTADRPSLLGRSRLVANDPYRLTVGLPRAKPTYRLTTARAWNDKRQPLKVSWANSQGYATATVVSDTSQTISWELQFEPSEPYLYPVAVPGQLQVSPLGISGAALRWPPTQHHPRAGYVVELNGKRIGVAFSPHAVLGDLEPGRAYRVAVRTLWSDGSVGKPVEATYTPFISDRVFLSDLDTGQTRHDWRNTWRGPGKNRSIDGNPLTVMGRIYEKGLGTHATSETRYELAGVFDRLLAFVGVDDEVKPQKPNEVLFEIWGDGRVLWKSGSVKSGEAAVPVDVDVRGVRELVLKTLPGSDGTGSDHADWLEVRVVRGG